MVKNLDFRYFPTFHWKKPRNLVKSGWWLINPDGRIIWPKILFSKIMPLTEVRMCVPTRRGTLFGRWRRALFPVGVQQIRGFQLVRRIKIRELHVLPGTTTWTGNGRRAAANRRRRGCRFCGTLRRRRRKCARTPWAQATGSRRLTRVPHWRYLNKEKTNDGVLPKIALDCYI